MSTNERPLWVDWKEVVAITEGPRPFDKEQVEPECFLYFSGGARLKWSVTADYAMQMVIAAKGIQSPKPKASPHNCSHGTIIAGHCAFCGVRR